MGMANAQGICSKSVKELATHELVDHALVAQNPKEMFGDKGRLYYVAILGTQKALENLLGSTTGRTNISNDVILSVAAVGDLEVMRMLLKAGGSVNARNEWGGTPLMIAAQCHELKMMSLLVKNGANVNAKATDGDDAMITAVAAGRVNEVEFLLEHDFVLEDSKTATGYTPSDIARKAENKKILRVLKKKEGEPVESIGGARLD
jgi:ankyrin repeat protein